MSPELGWAAGIYPCGTASCAVVVQTRDGGASWSRAPTPSITFERSIVGSVQASGGILQIRFADAVDGWIAARSTTDTTSLLWSTHDGGASWTEVSVPGGSDSLIQDLEASNGRARMIVMLRGFSVYRIYSTPAGADDWTASSSPQLMVGAGPVPSSQLVLHGASGWVLNNDRVVTGGAILTTGSGWSSWTPPCSDATGPGYLAAATATDLYAICEEGAWGSPAPGTTQGTWLFGSTDGGTTFEPIAALPGNAGAELLTASPKGTLVTAGAGLLVSTDGGLTWKSVLSTSIWIDYVGFTANAQAVALSAAGQMYMSHDGGASWSPVTF